MERFLQYAFTGLSAGSLYALVALGLVLMYRSSRVLNFAHGEMAVLGTFLAFTLMGRGSSFAVAFGVGIFVVAVLSVFFFFVVIVPAQIRGATHGSQIMLTLGLSLILQGLIIHNWGAEPERFSFPLSDHRNCIQRVQILRASNSFLKDFVLNNIAKIPKNTALFKNSNSD